LTLLLLLAMLLLRLLVTLLLALLLLRYLCATLDTGPATLPDPLEPALLKLHRELPELLSALPLRNVPGEPGAVPVVALVLRALRLVPLLEVGRFMERRPVGLLLTGARTVMTKALGVGAVVAVVAVVVESAVGAATAGRAKGARKATRAGAAGAGSVPI